MTASGYSGTEEKVKIIRLKLDQLETLVFAETSRQNTARCGHLVMILWNFAPIQIEGRFHSKSYMSN
jgi:hypothetical protein